MDGSGWRSMGKAFVLQWAGVDGDSFMVHAVPASPAFLGPPNGATMAAVLWIRL